MSTLKRFAKYIIWIIAFMIFTSFLVFVGFNANYHAISQKGELPSQISISKAEATKDECKIYGYVESINSEDLNGKYIKVSVYDKDNDQVATDYLKIENLEPNGERLFKSKTQAKNAKSFEIHIVDNK